MDTHLNMKLLSANIKNFKSLGDVDLKFEDLTIVVGSNASGKSNLLEALRYLHLLLEKGIPPSEIMQRILRVGGNDTIDFTLCVKDQKKQAEYNVSLLNKLEDPYFSQESLNVGKTSVIDVINSEGKVRDENGRNTQLYKSKAGGLALRSAGDFGNKPFTSKLADFIRKWEFYDLDPELMRREVSIIFDSPIINLSRKISPSLGNRGTEIQEILKYWAETDEAKFQILNQELYECMGMNIKLINEEEETIIKVIEQGGLEVPLSGMSDGTLRMIAYCTLLHQSEIPPLIGIEEPERNLHPRILKDVASILKKLSQKTQVIITTHSSQLLDCFSLDDVSSTVSVLLLSKKVGSGTRAFTLNELKENSEGLSDWMSDFGVGSAIYHSNLLQEILENE